MACLPQKDNEQYDVQKRTQGGYNVDSGQDKVRAVWCGFIVYEKPIGRCLPPLPQTRRHEKL
jgi:hypothetical protein